MTTLLAAAAVSAMALAGCSQTTTARCVDQDGNVLPDSACQDGSSGGVYVQSYGSGGHGATYSSPRWVYGGEGGDAVGSKATGYSTSPPEGGDISSPSGSVLRGGFGGEGEGHGGGEGGHGGGGE